MSTKYKKEEEARSVTEHKHPRTNSIEFVIPNPTEEAKLPQMRSPLIRNVKVNHPHNDNENDTSTILEVNEEGGLGAIPALPEAGSSPIVRSIVIDSKVKRSPFTQRIEEFTEEQLGPDSFDPIDLLGRGSFGKVYLVRHMRSKKLYALKILEKRQIFGQNLMRYALTEREVLKTSSHPFIV